MLILFIFCWLALDFALWCKNKTYIGTVGGSHERSNRCVPMYGNASIDHSIYKWVLLSVWSVRKNELRDRDAAAASAYLRGKLLLQEGMRYYFDRIESETGTSRSFSLLLNCNLIIRPSHYLRGVLCYEANCITLHKAHLASRLRAINHPCLPSDVC